MIPPARTLIVNADDLGMSHAVNRGISEAHTRGIVTSASLMVHGEALDDALAIARGFPGLGVGLHIDLGHWEFERGAWVPRYERVDSGNPGEAEREVHAQVDRFRQLLDCDPTHLDSHQHVHSSQPVASVARCLAQQLGIPLRGTGSIHYCGDFYGQLGTGEPYPEGITVEHLVSIIEDLPPGITELGCHPGQGVGPESSYREERALELSALCHPSVREAVSHAHVELRSFAGLSV